MIYTVAIGNTLVKFSSISRTEVLDETLDYASVVLHKEESLESKKMKEVVTITVNDGSEIASYYFLIDSDVTEPVDKDGLNFARHEISLIELTKRLDDYTVGHRQFTNEDDSLFKVLDDLIASIYLKNIALPDLSRTLDLNLSHSSLEGLKNIRARDFKFDNNTLREAIDTIFNEVGGVPRIILDNGVYKLTIDKLNERKTLRTILQNNENNYKQTHNSTKYATTMESYVNNQVFDKTLGGASIVEPSLESFMPVTTESAVFNSDNSVWKTRYPIRQITKAEMLLKNSDGSSFAFDMTPRLVHEDIYKGLPIGDVFEQSFGSHSGGGGELKKDITPAPTIIDGRLQVSQKIGTLTYNNNVISNLFTFYGSEFWTEVNMNYIINSMYYEKYSSDTPAEFYNGSNQLFQNLRIRITYVPIFDTALQVERYNTGDINRVTTMQTNQGASTVSTEKALKQMETLLSALGNKEIMTTNRHTLLANEFEVGDYTEDGYMLTKKEVSYFRDHFDVRYEWDKDFQKRNEDVGVDSALRLTEIPKGGISNRKLTYKEYVYIGFEGLTSETTLLGHDGKETFTNIFEKNETDNRSIQNAFVTNEAVLTTTSPILLPVISSGGGNVLNFNFGFQSPNVAGNQLDLHTQSIPLLNPILYTDKKGELENINWELINYATVTDDKTLPLTLATDKNRRMVGAIANRYVVKKDSADTLDMAYQIHMIPNTNIVLGDYMASRNNLIETRTNTAKATIGTGETVNQTTIPDMVIGSSFVALDIINGNIQYGDYGDVINAVDDAEVTYTSLNTQFDTLKVYESTEYYTPNETKRAKGTLAVGVEVTRISNEHIEIDATINNKSWAIATQDGDLVIAVNQFEDTQEVIKINYFDSRFDIDYTLLGEVIYTVPESPDQLVVLPQDGGTLQLAWVDNATDETYFLIEKSLDNITYTFVDTVPANTNQYLMSGLLSDTLYYVKVFAYNQAGTNDIPAFSSGTTDSAPNPPLPITDFIVTAEDGDKLNASWTESANAEDYDIDIKLNTLPDIPQNWTTANILASFTNYQWTDLTSATLYDTRVRARNAQGVSGYQTYFAFTGNPTLPETTAPTFDEIFTTEDSITFRVFNEDADPVTITTDYKLGVVGQNPPTRTIITDVDTVTGDITYSGLSAGISYTLSVTAQASGKTISSTVYETRLTKDIFTYWFDYNGGSGGVTTVKREGINGVAIVAPTAEAQNAEDTYYNFTGWSPTPPATHHVDNHNVTSTAQYSYNPPQTYTYTWSYFGGSFSQTALAGTSLIG